MKSIWKIIKFSKELWRYYVAISIFTIFIALLNQSQPLFIKGAIDQITKQISGGQGNLTIVIIFVVLIFITDVLGTLVSNVSGYFGDQLGAKLSKLLSDKYYQHLLSLSQSYFDTELTGKIINRLNRSISQISNFATMASNNFIQLIFSTVFTLIIVYYYSWQVGTMLLILYPIFFYFTAITSKKWQAHQKVRNRETDIATGRFAEVISQVKVVKSFLSEKFEVNFFNKHMDKMVSLTHPQSKYWHTRDIQRRLILNVIFFGVYGYIIINTLHGQFTIGQMVLLIQYAQLIRLPIFSMSFMVDATQRAIADSKDYFEVMQTKPSLNDVDKAKKLKISQAKIEFNNVDFAYELGEPVLKNINFVIEPDTKVALVGESGEGKTTISNLLMRLYDPIDGQILIDDQDIKEVQQASLRSRIGAVFQEPALFSGTIRENITYGKPSATNDEIELAAEQANAWGFISKLKQGVDTEIGERGLKLSGGQKQRIAIARAILKDAPILILDEATSSLDSKSEHEVQKALEKLMQGRTTMIIAHRLSTIAGVDKIITLKGGQVDEIGSPDELARSGGIYSQLLQLQALHSKKSTEQLHQFDIAS